MKRGLVLDRVVLLGWTLDEYRRYFALDLDAWRGRAVLDVAAGFDKMAFVFGLEALVASGRCSNVSHFCCWPWRPLLRRNERSISEACARVRRLPAFVRLSPGTAVRLNGRF